MASAVEQNITVKIRALVEGLNNVNELQSAVKAIQAQGSKKLGLDTSDAEGGASKFIGGLKDIGSQLANIKAGFDMVSAAGGFLFGLAKGAADAGAKFHDLSL